MVHVQADTPSALAEPRAFTDVDGVEVVWSPERGWLCSEVGHAPQPCVHTVDLPQPDTDPLWRQ